jgi:hypothetical protein
MHEMRVWRAEGKILTGESEVLAEKPFPVKLLQQYSKMFVRGAGGCTSAGM